MNEYPISPVYKIIGQIVAAALIIGGFLLLNRGLHWDKPTSAVPMFVLGPLCSLLGIWLIVGSTRLCLTVDDDAVRVRGGLGKRELPLGDIDGWRLGDKNRFYLVRKNGKGFIIPEYLSRRDDLIAWIKARYGDIDTRERAAETEVLLHDERYGASEEERKMALQKARTLAWILNPLCVVISFVLVWFPSYEAMIWLLYAMPWVAIFLTWRSRDLIRLSMRKGTPHPSLVYMMVAPAFILGIYASARLHFYGFSGHAWTVTSLAALATMLLALASLRGTIALEKQKTLVIVVLIVIAGFYGFGAAASSNYLFDRNTPQTLEATVLWKHIRHGKSTSYNLGLSPWGRYTEGKTVTVSRDFFFHIQRDDTVRILLYPGKWGIPWYRVAAYDAH